jgi:hypothetical protein
MGPARLPWTFWPQHLAMIRGLILGALAAVAAVGCMQSGNDSRGSDDLAMSSAPLEQRPEPRPRKSNIAAAKTKLPPSARAASAGARARAASST